LPGDAEGKNNGIGKEKILAQMDFEILPSYTIVEGCVVGLLLA